MAVVNFTCRTARSAAVTAILVALVVLETAVVHLLLMRVRVLALAVSAASLAAVVWLMADYVAMGGPAAHLDGEWVHLRVGRRARATIARAAVAGALAPGWQDLGLSAPKYLNPTKPASPNVFLVFADPQAVELFGAIRRPVRRIALHLDDPAGFLAALGRPMPSNAPPAAAV
ncbi:MAG: hypothetical protein ACM3SQ_13065 [Betaproteobacteria bacterium]